MNVVLLLLGLLLLALAVVDVLWTTLWVDGGAAPLTTGLATSLRRAILGLAGGRHRLLSLSGPAVLCATVGFWVALLWAGWSLIFSADTRALVRTSDQSPASWTGRIYFAAYTLFTMGNGDLTPQGGTWQLATAVASGSGILLITLIVTYVLSVVSAAVQKRTFASQVAALGTRSEQLVLTGWNGCNLSGLGLPLNSLASQLTVLTEQHLAYPILHTYHAANRQKSSVAAIAVLDEALTLIRFGVAEDCRPNPAVLRSIREAVRSYLDSIESTVKTTADEAPPPPNLQRLRQANIPTVDDAMFAQALQELAERRTRLLALVRNDGWSWSSMEDT